MKKSWIMKEIVMLGKKLSLQLLDTKLAICKLDKNSPFPMWATRAHDFFSITKTVDELSIVCPEETLPSDTKAERNWRAFKVIGPLDFALTGVLSNLIAPLAQHNISIFAISTYDTDYVLIKEECVTKSIEILKEFYAFL